MSGTGCFVFVSGEAGAGKSVLARRFCDDLPVDVARYYGFCDAFHTPRALGPLHDIARSGLSRLIDLLATEQDRHTVFSEFLALLAARPSVAVIEDIHWADEATLDLLVFLGRRVADLPCMVVVTLRSDEVGGDHPVRRVLGDLATARSVRRLSVPLLSQAAVAELAGPAGRDAAWLYAVTDGNPFFVSEALGAPGQDVPTTVRDTVLARAAQLSSGVRAVLDAVSVVPDRAEVAMVAALVAAGTDTLADVALDQAVQSGMLVREGDTVRIRHELARRAIESDVPAARATELHRSILAFLATVPGTDPARLSYHADAAGDGDAVLRYAPLAGQLAAGVGAHREAAEQYERALRHVAGAPAAQLAELWEGRADACERSHWMAARTPAFDALPGALEASARAVELWRAAGDGEREVVVMARRSHMLWNAGRRVEAHDTARAAVARLEGLPPGPAPARAYAALARLFMLADDDAAAISLGTTAVSYAQRYVAAGALAEALGVVGNAHWRTDPDRAAELLAAGLDAARSAGTDLDVAAILCNLGSGAAEVRRYQEADRWLGEAVRRVTNEISTRCANWGSRGRPVAISGRAGGTRRARQRPRWSVRIPGPGPATSSRSPLSARCGAAAATRTRSHRSTRRGRSSSRQVIFAASGPWPPHVLRMHGSAEGQRKLRPWSPRPTTSPSKPTTHGLSVSWATGCRSPERRSIRPRGWQHPTPYKPQAIGQALPDCGRNLAARTRCHWPWPATTIPNDSWRRCRSCTAAARGRPPSWSRASSVATASAACPGNLGGRPATTRHSSPNDNSTYWRCSPKACATPTSPLPCTSHLRPSTTMSLRS